MDDLIKRLRGWAERDTKMSEFGPDEHIAGIAADALETGSHNIDHLTADNKWAGGVMQKQASRIAKLEALLQDILDNGVSYYRIGKALQEDSDE